MLQSYIFSSTKKVFVNLKLCRDVELINDLQSMDYRNKKFLMKNPALALAFIMKNFIYFWGVFGSTN